MRGSQQTGLVFAAASSVFEQGVDERREHCENREGIQGQVGEGVERVGEVSNFKYDTREQYSFD